MRGAGIVPLLLVLVGAGAVADSVVRGGARVDLVLVVPVVSGSSAEFLLGVGLIFAGVFTLPLLWPVVEEDRREGAGDATLDGSPARSSGGGGGLVLIGPVPIFFGSWRSVSRRTRWVVAAVGGALLLLLIVVALLAAR